MNLEKLKQLEEITENIPNRLRESYLSKYVDLYNSIINYTNLDVPFIQKIWHWVNDFQNEFTCQCGNKTSFNRNWKDGYKKYCSAKCTQSNNDTKEKRKQTNLEKYGVDNVAKNSNIKSKMENTNLEKYGHKSSFQNQDVRDKWKESIEEKWGVDHYFKTDDFKIKAKSYYLQKWGVEHQLDVEEIKQKIKDTCMSKYGVETYLNTEHSRSQIKKYNKSSYETELYEWIISLGLECKQSHRTIPPLTTDLFIPEKNISIEVNGLYWHSELFKDKNYHLNKTLKCRELGIHLIHIWEDDWKNRKDIIKSILLNQFGLINNKVYARKCEIRQITNNEESSKFLNENHIQGWARASITYGLYFNGELVSLMSFGFRGTNGKREYELIRFCNKKLTSVVGSANKLFKHFLLNNIVEKIITYADISMFTGYVYENMGFQLIKHSGVNYWWVVNGIRKHRFTYNKQKLIKMGHDRTKTEYEIMHSIGNYRIWGCGQERWEFEFNIYRKI